MQIYLTFHLESVSLPFWKVSTHKPELTAAILTIDLKILKANSSLVFDPGLYYRSHSAVCVFVNQKDCRLKASLHRKFRDINLKNIQFSYCPLDRYA